MWLALVLVATEIAACPAEDRLRALHAVVIGLAVQARSRIACSLQGPGPGSWSDWRARSNRSAPRARRIHARRARSNRSAPRARRIHVAVSTTLSRNSTRSWRSVRRARRIHAAVSRTLSRNNTRSWRSARRARVGHADSWRASLHIKNARLRTAAQQFSSRRRTATPTEI